MSTLIRCAMLTALFIASSGVYAQETRLRLTSSASPATPCTFVIPTTGLYYDPTPGVEMLSATGDFAAQTPPCPLAATAQTTPAPVIVGPEQWNSVPSSLPMLPSQSTPGQQVTLYWAAVNASSCSFTGSFPAPVAACGSLSDCNSLHAKALTLPTSAGTYSYGLSCSNAENPVPVTRSASTTVVVPNIVIQVGPQSWNQGGTWQVGTQKSFAWNTSAATSGATCSFAWNANGNPSGLAVPAGCSGLACNNSQTASFTPTVAGEHKLTLTCRNAGQTAADASQTTVTGQWGTVTPASTCGVGLPAGWTQQTSGNVYYFAVGSTPVASVVYDYRSIWGRPSRLDPATTNWPGVENVVAGPGLVSSRSYVAAQFSTTGLNQGANLIVDETAYGSNGSPGVSLTVSKKCGDFSGVVDLANGLPMAGCARSGMTSNSSFGMSTTTTSSALCKLEKNTTYYLNIVNAPLPINSTTNPTPYNCTLSPCRVLFINAVAP